MQRAVQSGAFLGTSEMLIFQLMQGAKVMLQGKQFGMHCMRPIIILCCLQHPAFKAISGLFKQQRAESPLQGKL